MRDFTFLDNDCIGGDSLWGPMGLWFYEDPGQDGGWGDGILSNRYTKRDHPYSYSPFFIFGNHDTIEGSSADYTDRYHLWDRERYDKAIAAVGRQCRWDQTSPAEIDRFVKAYYGPEYHATGLVEWCNPSNGYPLWSIHFKQEG